MPRLRRAPGKLSVNDWSAVGSLVVGIAGGTGSGKTTLTQTLISQFAGHTAVVYHDNYYRARDNLTYEERTKVNYDSPDAFETDLMVAQLRQLIDGHPIDCPVYDFTDHNRSAEVRRIDPAPVIIVEGILIFAEEQLRDLFDIKIFVDTDADVRILRRIKRDVVERGRTLESVEAQYLATVKPMHELYVEPSKRCADIIVPEGGHNVVALEMLTNRIHHEISRR